MGTLKLIIVSINLAFTVQTVLAFWPPTAQINNSRIIGQTVTFAGIPVHQYLGIPYAQPPTGPNLFLKPKPIESYPPEFNAVKGQPNCQQHSIERLPWITYGDLSHDCLYLNIWAPVGANRWNKKAVMYWIHGGGFRYGGINSKYYDGTRLAALGNIIVVTVGYRLGYFGFFTMNIPEAPGNTGVWDVLEGLKWVNKYIPAFGGDPSKITIAGWDAGAITVGLLSISPLSKGLYARQIMQSGSPAYRRFDNNTQDLLSSWRLALMRGCESEYDFKTKTKNYYTPEHVVNCIKNERSQTGINGFEEINSYFQIYHLQPQFGDELLPENPRLSVINNNFRCTDLLIGTTRDEGTYLLKLFAFYDIGVHVNRSKGEEIMRKSVSYFPDPEAILKHYLPPTLQNDTDFRIRRQVTTAYGDTVYTCPSVYYAEKCAEQNKNVYYYQFNHTSDTSPWGPASPLLQIAHFDEVPYVFGQPFDKVNFYNKTYPTSEKLLSNQIIDIWSHFVKYGKPSVPWPLYSKENHVFKYVGGPDYVTYQNGKGPQTENCEFLRPHFGF